MSISIRPNPAEHLTLLPFFPTYYTSVTPTHAHRHPLSHTLIYCRASPPYCPVIYLYSLSHTLSELSLCVIITWGVDEVAPQLIQLDKIVQSERSELEEAGKMCVRGPFSPVRMTVLVFLRVDCWWWIHSNDSLSPLPFLWHDRFHWLFMSHWPQEVIFLSFAPMIQKWKRVQTECVELHAVQKTALRCAIMCLMLTVTSALLF